MTTLALSSVATATDFPTRLDMTSCVRLLVANKEVVAIAHGDSDPRGSLELISFDVNRPVAARLPAPDQAISGQCFPIEDTDLFAVIPPESRSVKVYSVTPDTVSWYRLTLLHTLTPASDITLNSIEAISNDGTEAIVSTPSGHLLLGENRVPERLRDIWRATSTLKGFILGEFATNPTTLATEYVLRSLDGAASISMTEPDGNAAAIAFDAGGVWVASPSRGLKKHALPALETPQFSLELPGFASVEKLLVSKEGHGVVIGSDALQHCRVMRFHPNGTSEVPVRASHRLWECEFIDRYAEHGMTNATNDGMASSFLLDLITGLKVGSQGRGGPLIGAPFIRDLNGKLYSARGHYYWDGVEITPVNLHQPDLLIGSSTSNLLGNGIYNRSASGQTISASLTRGSTKTFFVNVQNDGLKRNRFLIKSYCTKTGFKVNYFDGQNDISTRVENHGYIMGGFTPHESRYLRVRVTAPHNVLVDTIFDCRLEIAYYTSEGMRDSVKLMVRAK